MPITHPNPVDHDCAPPDLLPDTLACKTPITIAGCRLDDLAAEFGTPLYIFDEQTLRSSARAALAAFAPLHARVSFACKACETPMVLDILRHENLSLDVVSGGEIEVALRSGFRPEHLHLHGNAKSREDLSRAVQLGLRAIVVDNLDELAILADIARQRDVTVPIQLRITLPLEAETHPHLQTSGSGSKFGFPVHGADLDAAVARIARSPSLACTGLHVHLGSQISDPGIYVSAARTLIEIAASIRGNTIPISELSLGGGWAVPYSPGDKSLGPRQVADALAPIVAPSGYRLAVEPGRALVARAAVVLYTVRSVKRAAGHRIVAVDGGMADNPRPSLYGARYSAFTVPHGPADAEQPLADIVGRYCESGDVLVRRVDLGPVEVGDLICMPVAGAYHLPMASSYNLVPQPAVITVADGAARLATRRATVDDLLGRHLFPAAGPTAP